MNHNLPVDPIRISSSSQTPPTATITSVLSSISSPDSRFNIAFLLLEIMKLSDTPNFDYPIPVPDSLEARSKNQYPTNLTARRRLSTGYTAACHSERIGLRILQIRLTRR
ncbi:hypothetical protein E4U26_005085 [Claviceps purpurea]|nr:hypothetical protein E4U26_005085 [Claviceps purpurea]